jgi:hypothetical protein
MRKSFPILLLLFFSFVAIPACSSSNNETTGTPGYPIESYENKEINEQSPSYEFAYPTDPKSDFENNRLHDEFVIPTPSPNNAVVFGKTVAISHNNQPYIAPALYLGKIYHSDKNSETDFTLGSISIENDPKAIQDINGNFYFSDVPPGDYGLFIWMPGSAFILEDEKTELPITFEINPGDNLDLGTIYVP